MAFALSRFDFLVQHHDSHHGDDWLYSYATRYTPHAAPHPTDGTSILSPLAVRGVAKSISTKLICAFRTSVKGGHRRQNTSMGEVNAVFCLSVLLSSTMNERDRDVALVCPVNNQPKQVSQLRFEKHETGIWKRTALTPALSLMWRMHGGAACVLLFVSSQQKQFDGIAVRRRVYVPSVEPLPPGMSESAPQKLVEVIKANSMYSGHMDWCTLGR